MKKLFFLILLFSGVLKAQELPPIANYSPKFYGAENQNWAISQSEDQVVYVANNSGLLAFNGAKWSLYPSPNKTIIRSVNVIDDRVYTGCYMEFGYWEADKFGLLNYLSLSKTFQGEMVEDEQFWNILKIDDWILFQSLNRIYIYHTLDKTFDIIDAETRLVKVFKVAESIYFQKMNDGVYKIENGKSVLVSKDPIFKNNLLVNVFVNGDKTLFQTQLNGFYHLKNDSLKKWDVSANEIMNSISVYSSVMLKDGSIVLGTISNGVYQISDEGVLLRHINQEKGLHNNTVLSMFEDKDRNLWLGLDSGISVVNFNSPFRVYNDPKGEMGTVYSSVIFDGNLYLGTNQGLFYKKIYTQDEFQFIEGTNGQVWTLQAHDGTLFMGHDVGTFVVDKDMATSVSDVHGTWTIKSIANKKNLLLQGNYNGLNILEKKSGVWKFRNKIEGFNISSKSVEFTSDFQLFVNHEYKGVFKLDLNDDYTKVLQYDSVTSAPRSLKSGLASYANSLWFSAKQGVYKYDKKEQAFLKDTILSEKTLENDAYFSGKLIEEPSTNTLWGFTENNILYYALGKMNNTLKLHKVPIPALVRKDVAGYESLSFLNDESFLFGTASGYVIVDLKKLETRAYKVRINSIDKSILDGIKTAVSLESNGDFEKEEDNLYFTYAVPEYDKFTEVNYQYQLKGLYDTWSTWSSNSSVSFKNLPYGDYTFTVKAKIGNQISKSTASYQFTIQRPFMLSNAMLSVYIVLLLMLMYIVHIANKRYYKKQQLKLLEKKQRELSMSRLESEQQLMHLKNKQLNQEIESKNRELTISTMSIIKKNEILGKIKKELLQVENAGVINKQVIKTIDKNLNNKKDWEFLEEAFNNADKDFLRKIKKLHPDLTPNDLRFCAYLRLNLSSKEIAPLINISVRSVEIKRYRLRKKMNLDHEKSLVDYILTI